MDRRAMVGHLAAKYDLKVEENDPVFLLAELNQLLLEDSASKVVATLNHISEKADAVATASSQTVVKADHINQLMTTVIPGIEDTRRKMNQLGVDSATIAEALRTINHQYAAMYKHLDAKIGSIDVDAMTAKAHYTSAAAYLIVSVLSAAGGAAIALKFFAA